MKEEQKKRSLGQQKKKCNQQRANIQRKKVNDENNVESMCVFVRCLGSKWVKFPGDVQHTLKWPNLSARTEKNEWLQLQKNMKKNEMETPIKFRIIHILD